MWQNKKESLLGLTVLVGALFFGLPSFAQYASPDSKLTQFFLQEYQKYGVPIVNQSTAQILPLERADPRADTTETNLAYWLEKLPSQYQNFREYVLIRKYGLLLPIINPTAEDREAIDRGEVVPTDHYLERGAFWHYGAKPHQGNGNFVLAAHSSDKLSDAGAFKTAFAPLLITNPGDTIDYYTRNGDNFVRYEYNIFRAEVTDPYNTSILDQPNDRAMLTAYGCRPLGSTEERRFVQASLVKTEKGIMLQEEIEDAQVHEIAPIQGQIEELEREEMDVEARVQEIDTPKQEEKQIPQVAENTEPNMEITATNEDKEKEIIDTEESNNKEQIIEQKKANIVFQTQSKRNTESGVEKTRNTESDSLPTIKKTKNSIAIHVAEEKQPPTFREKAVAYINIRKKLAIVVRNLV